MDSRYRSASTVTIPTPLRSVDLPSSSLPSDGYFSRNVWNLEQQAEAMSQSGSDIAEEIRKMNEEQRERSRQNSIQSSHQGDSSEIRGGSGGVLGRVESRESSHGHSIVEVNGAARWGGYSPGGFVNSPTGSVRSGSWSHVSTHRKTSTSSASKLAQMHEPTQEGRPLDSPLTPSRTSLSSRHDGDVSRHPSQSSFSQRYDQIANEIAESLVHIPPSPPKHAVELHEDGQQTHESGAVTPPNRPRSTDTYQEAQTAFKDFDGVHYSPGAEYVELDNEGNEVRRVSARSPSGGLALDAASLLRTPRARPISYAQPPPDEGMVYYPAPVPRMLNLPKRLSQLPAAGVQAKRRTQVLSQLPPEVRNSAAWLSQSNLGDTAQSSYTPGHRKSGSGSQSEQPRGMLNERMSIANFNNLPPQLRATVFFDHQSIQQEVEVKSESAVATLDSILAASATAPVSAFTDHPFAGDVRSSVYAPELRKVRRSTATLATTAALDADAEKKVKKRRSSIGNLLRRSSSGNELGEQLKKQGSRSSLLLDMNAGGNKLQKRKSQMSLASNLDPLTEPVRTPGNETSEPDLGAGPNARAQSIGPEDDLERERRVASGSRPASAHSGQLLNDGDQIEDDFAEQEAQEDVDDGEPVFVQPTTLLAELQVRKAKLKSRTRTAATAFPNGMHSTLLQLDAVEQINSNRRKGHRVPLAWEDPALQGDDVENDDDVPLAVLFPSKDGLIAGKQKVGDGKDWDRPLGLMAKRELEDSEPLSSRRNRMLGLPTTFGRASSPDKRSTVLPTMSELHLAGQPDAPPEGELDGAEDPDEGETLAQRIRRLRTKDALDTAISDVAPKEGSRPVSTFTDDVLSQFGGLEAKEKPVSKANDAAVATSEQQQAGAGADEEETLGQRRARLQREREASGEQAGAKPSMLRSSSSLANLLAANPVGTRKVSKEHQPAQGTLLHENAQYQASQRAKLVNANARSSSYGLDRPLVDGRPHTSREPATAGLLGQHSASRAPSGGFAQGLYNNGLGGIGHAPLQTSTSTPMFGMNGGNGYFASPTAGFPYGMQHAAPGMMNPITYQALPNGAPAAGYGFPAMNAYGFGAQQMPYPGAMAMGMGMGTEPLDPRQRDAIDRWRMSVMQSPG